MKICKNCLQPDSRPGLYFTDDGICGACVWENEKNEIFRLFRAAVIKMKGKRKLPFL